MGARRSGFALILVLLVVAAIFAMTMHSAVVMRSAIVETAAVGSRQSDLRVAQGAASVVLRGLTTAAPIAAEGDEAADRSNDAGDRPEPDDRLDLPPIVRQMLAAAGKEIEDQAEREMQRRRNTGVDGAGTSELEVDAGGSALLRRVGLPREGVEVEIDGRRCVVELRDGLSGLNINEVDEGVIRSYLMLKGIDRGRAERITAELLDWRDEDSVPRGLGLERDGYRRLGLVPRDGRLRSVDELRMLPSMDDRVFALIRDDLVVAGDGSVHLGSASEAVLRSAGGLSEAQAAGLIALRQRESLTPERVGGIVDLRGESAKRLRIEPSGVVRVRVLVHGDGRDPSVFDGTAVVSGVGLVSLGLRAGRGPSGAAGYDD